MLLYCACDVFISVLVQWAPYHDRHVLPPYGLDSPVVEHLLRNWTSDQKKVIGVHCAASSSYYVSVFANDAH